MKLYRFSPIQTEDQLYEALAHIHRSCEQLCKQTVGEYLPVSGNIGIFCHYDDEYQYLTNIREKLTNASDNWKEKYFKLHKSFTIPAKDDMPEALYTYLYIRRTDPYRGQVGDADFVLAEGKFNELKNALVAGIATWGMRYRDDLGLIELFDPDIDVLAYVGFKSITEELQEIL